MKKFARLALSVAGVAILVMAYYLIRQPGRLGRTVARSARLREWFDDWDLHTDWQIQAGERCDGAAFIYPTSGYVGFLWDDSFRVGHRHQGIDTFTAKSSGEEAVIAAYEGYLTRLPEWKSTVIIRIPKDPLMPGRQIWTYYTHMANSEGKSYISEAFPPGTYEVYVPAGTLLGYQGNYSGTPGNPTGIHLHFSIVRDDGSGQFLNELDIRNTIDPSPYFNLELNGSVDSHSVVTCREQGIGAGPP